MIKARPVAGDPSSAQGFLRRHRAVRVPARAGARGDRRRPAHEGPAGGVHPAARQGAHRGQARPRRHPRRGVRGAAAADRARAARREAPHAQHARRPAARSRSRATSADADAEALADAYRFLRRLEHRLQIVRDLQTHDLPADRHARTHARALARPRRRRRARRAVRAHDRTRPFDPRAAVLPAAAGSVRRPGAMAQLAHGTDRAATEELLGGLGFADPARSYDVLGRLVDPSHADRQGARAPVPGDGAGARALARRPTRRWCGWSASPRPSAAMTDERAIADLLAGRSRRRPPARARRRRRARSPSDLLVADPDADPRAVATRCSAVPPTPAGELVDADRAERRPRAHAARRPARRSRPWRCAWCASAVDGRRAATCRFAVIGMGKLGRARAQRRERPRPAVRLRGRGLRRPAARAAQAAERVLRDIRDAGWEPDADLRPEGRNGPLARSIAGYLEYWERYAETWEFQSLLRARAVAGDPDLGRRFELNAADFAFPPDGITIDRVAEIRRMRERIERERVKPPEAAKFHFKLGVRLARRRAVRGGALADAPRRRASGDPVAPHARSDRPAGRGEAARGHAWRATWARRSCSCPT